MRYALHGGTYTYMGLSLHVGSSRYRSASVSTSVRPRDVAASHPSSPFLAVAPSASQQPAALPSRSLTALSWQTRQGHTSSSHPRSRLTHPQIAIRRRLLHRKSIWSGHSSNPPLSPAYPRTQTRHARLVLVRERRREQREVSDGRREQQRWRRHDTQGKCNWSRII